MTHLRIEQSTGVIEEVSTSIISKLYELAYAGLDASSNLQGRLHVTKAYGNEIDWLTQTYNNLYITADTRYIKFADPVMQNLMPSYYGDGIGVTLQDMQSVTRITGTKFENETNITSFDELGLFTSVVSIGYGAFKNCTNLSSIDLSNINDLDTAAFRDCTSLTGTIYLPNLITFASGDYGAFQGCTGITSVVIGGNTPTLTDARQKKIFNGCTALTSVTGLSNLTFISRGCFQNCTSLTTTDIDWSKITLIENDAFYNCTSLSTIGALSLCSQIQSQAFYGCSNLNITDWDLSSVTRTEGSYQFRDCSNLKGTLDLSGLTYGYVLTAFVGCSSLQKVILGHATMVGSSRIRVSDSTFYNCSALKVIDIHQLDGLRFSNNTIINNSVLEALIIRNTSQIPTITIDNNTSIPQISWSYFTTSAPNAKIYVDDNLYSTYMNDSNWSILASHIDVISNYVAS